MSTLNASSSLRVPKTIKSNQSKKIDETKVGRMTAKNVVDDLEKVNGMRIISLKDESGELPEGIECIAADFANVQKGVINSIVSPMTLSLKKEDHKKRVKLTNLKKLKNIMSKFISGEEKPFARFEKVQIMYVPLFNREESEHGSMTVSLTDHGKEIAGNDPIIQTVSFESDEMALVELSMNYFIAKKDIECISLEMSVDRLPVEGRAYGAMFIAFFVHEEHSPMRMEEKQSTLLYIDSLKAPTDINTTSVFKGLGDKISAEVKGKRNDMKSRRRENNKSLRKGMKNVELVKTDSSSEDAPEMMEAGRKSVSILNDAFKNINVSPAADVRKRNLSFNSMRKTILDTGSAEHYIYYPGTIPNNIMKNIVGISELEVEKASIELIIDNFSLKLTDVWLHKSEEFGLNLISYTKLKEDKLIDGMSTEGDNVYLEMDKEVVLQFDASSPGRMWLKDSIWAETQDSDAESSINGKLVRPKSGLGIKYVM